MKQSDTKSLLEEVFRNQETKTTPKSTTTATSTKDLKQEEIDLLKKELDTVVQDLKSEKELCGNPPFIDYRRPVSNQIKRHGKITEDKECLMKCCADEKCNIAFLLQQFCYTVTCPDAVCITEVVRDENFKPRVAVVRGSIEILPQEAPVNNSISKGGDPLEMFSNNITTSKDHSTDASTDRETKKKKKGVHKLKNVDLDKVKETQMEELKAISKIEEDIFKITSRIDNLTTTRMQHKPTIQSQVGNFTFFLIKKV